MSVQLESDAHVFEINSATHKYLERKMETLINAIIWFDTVFSNTRDPLLKEYRRYQRQMVMCAVLAVMGIVGAIIFGNLSYNQPVNGILQGVQHVVEHLINYLYLCCLVVVISASIAYFWIVHQLYHFTNE